MPYLALICTIIGFIIGLGAVTVIDIHGFLGRKRPYWSEATIRTHKVTKPLIWIGIGLYGLGLFLDGNLCTTFHEALQLFLLSVLILNGTYLSFVVSPYLLAQEKAGDARHLLPRAMQQRIALSFVISLIGWWGSVALWIIDLGMRLGYHY